VLRAKPGEMSPGGRIRDVAISGALPIIIAVSLCTLVWFAYLGANSTFNDDDWAFALDRRGFGIQNLLAPYGEHWVTVPLLIFNVLFRFFGLRTHLPYIVALECLHAGCVVMLFVIIRRHSGDLPALLAGFILAIPGFGAENVFVDFQITFLVAVVLGLLAFHFFDFHPNTSIRVERFRRAIGTVALVLALMSSGIGLLMFGFVGVDLALDRRRRHELWWLAIPLLVYTTWFLSYGRGGYAGEINPQHAILLLHFVPRQIVAVAAGIIGVGDVWRKPVEAALVLLTAYAAVRVLLARAIDGRLIAAGLALIGEGVITGLARADLGIQQAEAQRYVYVGEVFLLIAGAELLAAVKWSNVVRTAVIVLGTLAVHNNVNALVAFAAYEESESNVRTAELATVDLFKGAPSANLDGRLDESRLYHLTPRRYLAITSVLGSPVRTPSLQNLESQEPIAVDLTMYALFDNAFRTGIAPSGPQPTHCLDLSQGLASYVDLAVPPGRGIALSTTQSTQLEVEPWFASGPLVFPPLEINLAVGTIVELRTPDTGGDQPWHLRLVAPPAGTVTVCH
jgi:hypothetical protein